MKKILIVFGTRPEAIKMCPLILELKKHSEINCRVCVTGQHKEMLRQVMDIFKVVEDYNLDIMCPNQTLSTITMNILGKIEKILVEEKPDIILVHGDTTTSFVAALAAFYQKIPVGHVEAGLRTGNIYSPFPEEMNRILTAKIAKYHFAPTERNKTNLNRENIYNYVYVTGNTVIDALKTTVKPDYKFRNEIIRNINFADKRIILLTAHRRENIGGALYNICNAVIKLVEEYRDVEVVYPVHLNPAVRETVIKILGNNNKIHLVDPIDVLDMHNLMARCFMVMTDSGGIQEEAPSLGKPVLVLRTETERPEAVNAGTVKVVGVKKDDIFQEARLLLDDVREYQRMACAVNPYGDGQASRRIVEILLNKEEGWINNEEISLFSK